MSSFLDLARLPFAEVFTAIETSGRVPGTSDVVPFYVTNAPALWTEPTDEPPNIGFRNVLLGGWSTTRRLNSRLTFAGESAINYATLTLDNSRGDFDSWRDLDFNGQAITIKLGGRIKADGSAYPWSDYATVFVGVIESIEAGEGSTLELTVRGRKLLCQQPVVEDHFTGFGGGLYVPALTSSATATAANHSSFDTTGAITVEFFGVIRGLGASQTTIFQKGVATNVAYRIGTSASGGGSLLRTQIGSNTNVLDATGYSPPLNAPLHLAVTITASGAVVFFAGPIGSDLVQVGAGALAGGAGSAPVTGAFAIGDFSGLASQKADVEAWEIRVWNAVRSLEQLIESGQGPLASPKTVPLLKSCWKFGDGTGAVAKSEINDAQALTLAFCEFRSSFTGDDPEQWPGGASVLGQTKPGGWGTAFNVPTAPVDSQFGHFMVSKDAGTDVHRAKVNGAPLVPDETITASALESITFTAATKTITLGGNLSAHRLIPGQTNPARTGQQIDISGTSKNNATRTIAPEGITADGKNVKVLETLQDEVSTAAVIVSTPAGVQFSYTLDPLIITPTSIPSGVLTADVVLSLGSGAKVSDVAGVLLAGETVDYQLDFDPVVGIHLPAGQELTRCDLLNALMRSCLGWWAELRDGTFRIGNFGVPDGDPVAVIAGSRIAELDVTASIIGRIESISPIRATVPSWELKAAYDQTWHVHDPGSLVASLTPAARLRLSEKWQFATPKRRPGLRLNYTTSTTLKPIETYIVNRADAETLLIRGADLLSAAVRWWEVKVAGMGLMALELYDTIFLQHPDSTHGIQAGTLAKVVSIEEDSSSDLVNLEVYAV